MRGEEREWKRVRREEEKKTVGRRDATTGEAKSGEVVPSLYFPINSHLMIGRVM